MIKIAIFERAEGDQIDQAVLFYDDDDPDGLVQAQVEADDMLDGDGDVTRVATAGLIVDGYREEYHFPAMRAYIG